MAQRTPIADDLSRLDQGPVPRRSPASIVVRVVGPTCAKNSAQTRKTMKTIVLVSLVSLVVAAGAADSAAQTAGSSVVSVTKSELRQVASGWSAKKQILGKDVYNDTGEKIGEINDLIVAPNKSLSYAIVGVGGFL